MPLLAELTGDETMDNCRTFVFENEDHTLGNALRSIIVRYPEVVFVGYTIPHPAESTLNFRIQTTPSVRAIDILRRGLQDLEAVCDVTLEKFDAAMQRIK
ncbi:probable DNA-directed RNA polymerases I and III subunit RPAC2 [Lutzomyia longipalpis]|uniref:probable DNA-directed RNA polymerases I and III subunit RPAC2 n=1 Tax=Lutzomyia longipalpis TaxID=7200 RepID=UPI0024833ECB|nr:probable DNA-directed RNA polymerases I and III subunit RPAC2 [Lutzomyia longipalpis]